MSALTQTQSRYELRAPLAAGGMGEVFVAEQHNAVGLRRTVALKLLLPHLSRDRELVEMFLDEARLASSLNHPHVLPVLDAGELQGRYFIAMPLVQGVSLSTLLKACRQRSEHVPLPVVRAVGAGLCDALAYLHGHRDGAGDPSPIVHRDVSPGNLLLSTSGAVLLTDFGVAKAKSNLHRTRTGALMGKFAYAAPEQLRERETVGTAADVYAAGVLLFEMLTLRSPFLRESEGKTFDAVLKGAAPEAVELRPDAPAALVDALRTAMRSEPSQRQRSARELRDALTDGPVATDEELGAFLERICEESLAAVRSAAAAEPACAKTRTLNPVSATTKRRRQFLAAAALSLVIAAAVAGVTVRASRDAHARPELSETARGEDTSPFREPPAGPRPTVLAPGAESDARASAEPSAASRASPRKSPHRSGLGFLTMDATPWATVFIDGKQVDTTPISRYPLTQGVHEVLFRNAPLQQERRRTVHVGAGKLQTLSVDFSR